MLVLISPMHATYPANRVLHNLNIVTFNANYEYVKLVRRIGKDLHYEI
jgi:hypothetical protein